ncbi:mannose/fructose/sorbose PTS transporter subunit IIA [Candidatus Enterococcus ferrettii]|uniref:PTS system, fructose-specific IIA component n=1 Tax=Candidatus Enterococcus ferrettii TaxID=2815324 RepID=A0ABV0ESL9_9ENTE|nr:mannose/fructose/sorbose PTS transporter subunit IIA [Enterococcus sp. 665A]MBO1342345.1 PTS fructose transporter subunit IIA [Enterococcus sp. 665A]
MSVIIVSGHGDFSLGLLDAFEMVFGTDEKIKAIPFKKGEGIPQLQEKYHEQLRLFPEEEILFLVDIYGGTPYNAASQLIFGQENCDVVTGVNLPMLLETAAQKDQALVELTKVAKTAGESSAKVFSEEISKITHTDLEDDEL